MIAVDYEMYASAELARSASASLVDERGAFETSKRDGRFSGFPDPTYTLGEFFASGSARPSRRVLATHLGMGLTDLLFAVSIADRARELGLGVGLADLESHFAN